MSILPDGRDRVLVGRIVGAHGVKGVIRVHPLTDYPERFLDMRELYVERAGKPHRLLEVLDVAPHVGKGQFLFTVSGVTDRDGAEALNGWLVTVDPDERVELPAGEYWIDSLVGLAVFDVDSGERLGTVEDVLTTGSNDVYQVRTPDGVLKMVPAIADVVREIDLETCTMKIFVMEGLWD